MTTIEKKKEHLKVFQNHIKTSRAKFDTTEKFEFQRRETAYYAARYSKKILYGSRAEAEKNLIKLTHTSGISKPSLFLVRWAYRAFAFGFGQHGGTAPSWGTAFGGTA